MDAAEGERLLAMTVSACDNDFDKADRLLGDALEGRNADEAESYVKATVMGQAVAAKKIARMLRDKKEASLAREMPTRHSMPGKWGHDLERNLSGPRHALVL
jgi:hypothetical protein